MKAYKLKTIINEEVRRVLEESSFENMFDTWDFMSLKEKKQGIKNLVLSFYENKLFYIDTNELAKLYTDIKSGNISYDSYDDFDSSTEFLALRGTEMVEILDQFGDGESLYYEKISPLLNELDEIREKDGFLVGLNFAVINMIENEYQERGK